MLTFYYLLCRVVCKSGRGQDISIFLSRSDELLSRFVYPRFPRLRFSAQPETLLFFFCLIVSFFSDILYFHSCGIVGIMTTIKFAHVPAVL